MYFLQIRILEAPRCLLCGNVTRANGSFFAKSVCSFETTSVDGPMPGSGNMRQVYDNDCNLGTGAVAIVTDVAKNTSRPMTEKFVLTWAFTQIMCENHRQHQQLSEKTRQILWSEFVCNKAYCSCRKRHLPAVGSPQFAEVTEFVPALCQDVGNDTWTSGDKLASLGLSARKTKQNLRITLHMIFEYCLNKK